jgi:hypothetical protein
MIRALVDLVFPPYCVDCGAFTRLKYLCEDCWKQSVILDSFGRCQHCFEEVERGTLCARCARAPLLPFERAAVFDRRMPIYKILGEEAVLAAASFAYYQWLRLDWKEPDLIVPMPGNRFGVAQQFALLCNKPVPKIFRRIAWPLGNQRWEVVEHLIEENATVLIFDEGSSQKQLQLAATALSTAFPKKVFLLSLFA